MTPSPESVAFELYAPYTSTPSNPHPQNIAFWELQNSLRRNLEILHADHHRHTDSRLLFQKRWKSVQGKWPKGRVVFLPKKTFCPVWWNSWAISPTFCLIPYCCSSLIGLFRVLSKSVQVWRVIAEKSFRCLRKLLKCVGSSSL